MIRRIPPALALAGVGGVWAVAQSTASRVIK